MACSACKALWEKVNVCAIQRAEPASPLLLYVNVKDATLLALSEIILKQTVILTVGEQKEFWLWIC